MNTNGEKQSVNVPQTKNFPVFVIIELSLHTLRLKVSGEIVKWVKKIKTQI